MDCTRWRTGASRNASGNSRLIRTVPATRDPEDLGQSHYNHQNAVFLFINFLKL
jgi:hypothetical protein